MSRRKITGILQYGTRKYAKQQVKFLEGGSVAVGEGYNWREDPYELMLLRHKTLEENAKIKAERSYSAGKKTSGFSGKKIDTFDSIKGGLFVSNAAANVKMDALHNKYYDAVRANGIEWASSLEGQIAHSNILKEQSRLENYVVGEKDNYTEALKAISLDDKETLAISTGDNIMVWDIATGEGSKIDLGTYVDNVDKFKPMTISQFAVWKDKADTSLNAQLTDEFLKQNAVGHNTLRKDYIDGKEDQIRYAFENGKIIKKTPEGTTAASELGSLDIEQFRVGINNLLSGGSYYDNKNATIAKDAQSRLPLDVANEIYSDIMSGAASNSKLDASLTAEVLSDLRQLNKLKSIKGKQEKLAYLEEQKKYTLVRKLVDKTFKAPSEAGTSKSAEEADTSGGDEKAKSDKAIADMLSFANGNNIATYVYGKDVRVAGTSMVVDIKYPMVKDGLSPADFKLVTDAKDKGMNEIKSANNIYTNDAVQGVSDTTDIYTSSGANFDTIFGDPNATQNFFGENVAIAPNATSPIIYMPMDSKGNLRSHDFASMTNLKAHARREFLKSVKGKLNITTPANELFPGNVDKKAAADAKEYSNWIQKGVELRKYVAMANADPTNQEKIKNLSMAKDAAKVIRDIQMTFDKKFAGEPIKMQAMLGTWVLFTNDDQDIKGAIETKSRGMGTPIYPATASEKKYMQDVNKIDPTNMFGFDNWYKTMVFTKVKPIDKIASEKGQTLPKVARLGNIQNMLTNVISSQTPMANPNEVNVALFLTF